MEERREQRKLKKEEKRSAKLEKKRADEKASSESSSSAASGCGYGHDNSLESLVKEEMEVFCFCYFNSKEDMQNWQSNIQEVFQELKIPRNALIVTESGCCDG